MTTAAPTASAVPATADLDPAVQTLIEDERVGHPQRLRGRFLSSAVFLGGSFLAVAVVTLACGRWKNHSGVCAPRSWI